MNTPFMLEYLMPEKPSGGVTLHANRLYDDGKFDYPLNSNGYKPLALFDGQASETEEYRLLCDWLHTAKPDYEEARSRAEAIRDAIKSTLKTKSK